MSTNPGVLDLAPGPVSVVSSAQGLPAWTSDALPHSVVSVKGSSYTPTDEVTGELTPVARWNVDREILTLLEADLGEAMSRWRSRYDQRARCGTNRVLWSFTRALASIAEAAMDNSQEVKRSGARGIIRQLVVEFNLCSFLEVVVSEDDFYREYPDFIMSILDILLAVVDGAADEDSTVVLEMLRCVVPALCSNLWRSRGFLTFDENIDRFYPMSIRGICRQLSRIMLHISILESKGHALATDRVLRRASFLCWFYSPDSEIGEVTSGRVLTRLYIVLFGRAYAQIPDRPEQGHETPHMLDSFEEFMRLDVVPAFGAKPYMKRLLETLQQRLLMGDDLDWAVICGCRTIMINFALLAELAPSGVLRVLLEIVQQTLRARKHSDKQYEALGELLGLYGTSMRMSVASDGLRSVIPALIREGRLVEMIARGIRVRAIEGQNCTISYTSCLNALGSLRPCVLSTNQLSAKNNLRKIMRQGFREHWYPTLDVLRRFRTRSPSVTDHDRMIRAWKSLGEDLGFDQEMQSREYERELQNALRHCAWKECQYHEEEPQISLRACKGCEEVRYCSTSCQRSDWRDGHKRQCKRLNDSSPPHAS